MKTEKEIKDAIVSLRNVANRADWSFETDGALSRISMLQWVLDD